MTVSLKIYITCVTKKITQIYTRQKKKKKSIQSYSKLKVSQILLTPHFATRI